MIVHTVGHGPAATSETRGIGMTTRVSVVARPCPRVRGAEVASCPRRRGLADEGAHRHRLTSLLNFAHLRSLELALPHLDLSSVLSPASRWQGMANHPAR